MNSMLPAPDPLMRWMLDRISISMPTGVSCPEVATEKLAALLQHHRAAAAINMNGLTPSGLPEGVFETLMTMRRRRAIRQLGIAAELHAVLKALEGSETPVLVLKGLANGGLFHDDPLRRDALDIDLLVSDGSFRTAGEALKSIGYEERETATTSEKDVIFSRPQALARIELHHRLFSEHALFPIDARRLLEQPTRTPLLGRTIPTLSRETAFVYAAAHGFRHFWARLFWLLDIEAAAHRPDMDWDATFRLSEELGATLQCAVALALSAALLRSPVPPPFNNDGRRNRAEAIAAKLMPFILSQPPLRDREIVYRMGLPAAMRLELSVQPGLKRKAQQLLGYLKPTEQDFHDGGRHPIAARLSRISAAWRRN